MTPNQILRQTRRLHEMTMEQMAQILGMTTQRISQLEKGDAIPVDRIREWAHSSQLPDWASRMADQMWLAALEQQHAAIGEQIVALGRVVMEQ